MAIIWSRASVRFSVAAMLLFFFSAASPAESSPQRILVLGDSLSSGFMLPPQTGFPYVLARRLKEDGYRNLVVLDGSVAGATTADGLERLPQALSAGADLVIVELGGNDMLDKTDPRQIFDNLDQIISICKAAGARVILAGVLALLTYEPAYRAAFDSIYARLAAKRKIPLYPFFLAGAFGHPGLMLSDGTHPSALGVERIVAGILPLVERSLSGERRRVASAVSR